MSQEITEYLVAFRVIAERSGEIHADSEVATWLEWAEEYARRLDPLTLPIEALIKPPPARPA